MRTNRSFCLAGLVLLSISLWGQIAPERTGADRVDEGQPHLGYSQDWSSRHLLMPGLRQEDILKAGVWEPRHVYNMVMRQVAAEYRWRGIVRQRPRPVKIDWAVSMENGYVPRKNFPAKYQFQVTAESCNADYVVFGLTVTSGTQANLVGINNLYTEATPKCNSGTPWVAFAYNTALHAGEQITTSPTISGDGTKVAFVSSTGSATYFHVLALPNPIPTPPSQTGTVLAPQTPTTCAAGPTVPGCMTTLLITNASGDSNSSPWIDYQSDTAYVGTDNGVLWKIFPVFNHGTAPALVNDASNWPVAVSTQSNSVLTDPIVDDNSGKIFLGDGEGYLYSVNLTNPAKTYSAAQTIGWATHGPGTGIVDAPIVVNDSANSTTDQVFAFTGCSSVLGIGGAVTQVPANFTTGAPTTSNTVDLGSATGVGDCTTDNLLSGTFDNKFWTNGTTSGHLIACGFVSGTTRNPLVPSNPKMYFFPFANHVITSAGASSFVIDTTVGEECSPLTEFYNGTTDRLFFGVGGPSTPTEGFLQSSTITTSLTTPVCGTSATSSCVKAPAALGGTSGIVIDNQLSNGGTNIYFTTLGVGSVNSQKCNVSGGIANPYCAVKLTQSGLQ
jgi:hypothetical protein